MHADRQCDGDDGRQLLRDGTHGQGHSGIKHLSAAATSGQAHQRRENRQTQHKAQNGDAEAPELARQRCAERGTPLQGSGQIPQFGGITGGDHQPTPLAGGHEAAGVGHAVALCQRSVSGIGTGGLGDRQGFAGEAGFIQLQVAHLQQPQVGGHLIACGQKHHIAGHQVLGLEPLLLPVTQDFVVGADLEGEGPDRALSAALLHKPDHRIDHGDAPDHRRFPQRSGEGFNRAGDQQGIEEGGMELGQKLKPQRPLLP